MDDIIVLTANQPADRFYRGGPRIAALRDGAAEGDRVPEDWIASTVVVRGEEPAGRTTLPDGRDLREAIEADPEHWLGSEHARVFGADPMLLTKVLDAGERLPVHVHPSDEQARTVLGEAHGKAEAWYILTSGAVYLGFARDVSAAELEALVDEQDSAALLAACNRIDVQAGDCVFVPPCAPHAIGEGVLLIEVQEPADISLLLEHERFGVTDEAGIFAGMGRAAGLAAVDRRGVTGEELEARVVRAGTERASRLAAAADPFFRLALVDSSREPRVESGYRVLVVIDGEGAVRVASGASQDVQRGTVLLLPAAAGEVTLSEGMSVLVARPPLPATV